jgi:hypothetical protein
VDVFTTIRRARSLGERHSGATNSAKLVALYMATYAEGSTGRNIRPGYAAIARETGLDIQTVKRAVRWLEEQGELWRTNADRVRAGTAACFTYRLHGQGVQSVASGGAIDTPQHQHQPTPSGLPGPRHVCAEWDDFDTCAECGAYRYDETQRKF